MRKQIYSFVAQKDAKANIKLAESMAVLAVEARGDNKVMKSIAVLGMFFLPGTFVAVCKP
jgi:Mg2+ and Co2+ transporter CorA